MSVIGWQRQWWRRQTVSDFTAYHITRNTTEREVKARIWLVRLPLTSRTCLCLACAGRCYKLARDPQMAEPTRGPPTHRRLPRLICRCPRYSVGAAMRCRLDPQTICRQGAGGGLAMTPQKTTVFPSTPSSAAGAKTRSAGRAVPRPPPFRPSLAPHPRRHSSLQRRRAPPPPSPRPIPPLQPQDPCPAREDTALALPPRTRQTRVARWAYDPVPPPDRTCLGLL